MAIDRNWPVKMTIDIDPDGLKHVVEEGRLGEFVEALSTLAAANIKSDIIEHLAKGGVGLEKPGMGVSIVAGFDVDDPYGTGPKPWPWPWWRHQSVAIDTVPLPERITEEWVRRIVHEELKGAGRG